MSIEFISFYILGLIAIGVISYLAGRSKWRGDVDLLEADLLAQKLARREQQRKYDQLYDTLLRVNKLNTELNKKVQSITPKYGEVAVDMVTMLNMGFSRRAIAKKYGVPYATVCFWIRKKAKELEAEKREIRQTPLV